MATTTTTTTNSSNTGNNNNRHSKVSTLVKSNILSLCICNAAQLPLSCTPLSYPLAVTPPPLCHAPRHCHGKWPPHGKCNIRNVSVRLISALGVFLFVSFAIPLPSLWLSLSICLFLVTLFGQLIMHKMHWQQQIDKGSDALRASIGSFLPEPRLVLSQRDACVNRQLYPRYCLVSRSGSSDFSTRSLIKSDATKGGREREREAKGATPVPH